MNTDPASPSSGRLRLDRGQKLHELRIIERILVSGINTIVVSPPNTGKSYAAIREAYAHYEQTGTPFVFAADTKSLVDDLVSTHEGDLTDLQGFHAGYASEPDPSRPLITTYDSVKRFVDEMAGGPLIVDEWHSLMTAYGYREKAIRSLASSFRKFSPVIGLTGTEAFSSGGFTSIYVDQDRLPLTVNPVNFTKLPQAVAREIADNPRLTHFVSVFSKGGIADKIKISIERNGISSDNILVFNSETTDDDWVRDFMSSNILPGRTRVVIGTFTQGFSVSGSGAFMVHIVPDYATHSALDIAQVVQRFREEGALRRVNLYHTFPHDGPPKVKPTAPYKAALAHEAKRQGKVLWEMAGRSGEPDTQFLRSEENRNLRLMIWNHSDRVISSQLDKDKRGLLREDLSTDTIRLQLRAYENDRANAYLSRVEMNTQLGRYGLRLGSTIECDTELDDLDEIKAPPGADSAEVYNDRVEEMWDSAKLSRRDLVEGRLAYLRRYFSRDQTRKLALEHRTKLQWSQLVRRIDVARAKTGDGKRLREAVIRAFPLGTTHTSGEIIFSMGRIFKSFPMLSTSKPPKRSLEDFVSLSKRTTERRDTPDGKSQPIPVYRVLSVEPLPFRPKYRFAATTQGMTARSTKNGNSESA